MRKTGTMTIGKPMGGVSLRDPPPDPRLHDVEGVRAARREPAGAGFALRGLHELVGTRDLRHLAGGMLGEFQKSLEAPRHQDWRYHFPALR